MGSDSYLVPERGQSVPGGAVVIFFFFFFCWFVGMRLWDGWANESYFLYACEYRDVGVGAMRRRWTQFWETGDTCPL